MPTHLVEKPYTGVKNVSRAGGLVKSYFLTYQEGIICFPTGGDDEFGCGSSLTIHKGEKRSLNVKIPTGVIDVELGQEYEWGRDCSYTSGKCEWCSPEICYPNSQVTVWRITNWFKKWILRYDKNVIKTKYGRGGVYQNCNFDLRCKCNQVPPANADTKLIEEFDINNGSLLIVPHSFIQRTDVAITSNLHDTADDIQNIIREELEDVKRSEPGIAEGIVIGVLNPTGDINWIYSSKSDDNGQISLLSLSRWDIDDKGQGMLNLDSRLFPVLAATSQLPNSEASISLDFYGPDENDVIGGLEIKGEVSTKGLFTVVWTKFDIQEVLNNDPNYIQSLKDGSIAVLKIVISGNGKQRELTQKYTLTLPPRS